MIKEKFTEQNKAPTGSQQLVCCVHWCLWVCVMCVVCRLWPCQCDILYFRHCWMCVNIWDASWKGPWQSTATRLTSYYLCSPSTVSVAESDSFFYLSWWLTDSERILFGGRCSQKRKIKLFRSLIKYSPPQPARRGTVKANVQLCVRICVLYFTRIL